MKLLSPKDAQDTRRKENEQLLDDNLRLRKLLKAAQADLRNAKEDYTPEKQAALKEYNAFTADLNEKRQKSLKELATLNRAIEEKKEIYYGLVAKQDVLEERIYQNDERERKLDLREKFIKELEKKQNAR